MFNRPLNVKVRKIDPNRRMLHTHPFYIWQVLMRFRTMDKLIGVEHQWRTPAEIARQLFINFDELTEYQQNHVIRCKLDLALAMLKHNYWLKERETREDNPQYLKYSWADPYIIKEHNEWQARAQAFGDLDALPVERRQEWTAEAIDAHWALWIGRPDYHERATRALKKLGIEV